MNKEEFATRVAEKSRISVDVCLQVLTAFEEVLSEEFSASGSMGGIFDKVYRLMSFFKNKKKSEEK